MKQKLLSALLMSAFAGVATTASAGVIQASYKNFAAEIFGTDVAMTVPVIGYSLAQPLTGSALNPNQFEITWTLSDGEWDAGNLPTATLVSTQNGQSAKPIGLAGTVTKVSAKVLKAAFNLNAGTTFPVGSNIVLGQANAATDVNPQVDIVTANGKIAKVADILRKPADDACNPTTAKVDVTVRLTNAAGVEFESNFSQAPLNNTTPILQSGVALSLTVKSSSAFDANVAANNESSQVNVLQPALGKAFTNTADVTGASTTIINLGQVIVGDRQTLFDLNGDVPHSVSDVDWNANVAADGGVSQNGLSVKIAAAGKFASDGVIFAASDAACTTQVGADATINTALTEATLSLTQANLLVANFPLAGGKRTVNVCYKTAGGKVIPTSTFAVTSGSLAKAAASNEIASPVCPGNLYNLTANGVRVDVRNYIPAIVEAPSGGWKNVVRIINTDESQPSVDVIGTALLRDGTLGATAVIAAGMKPREVRYLSGAQIDALLNAAATATAKSFGADDISANARLRITAPSASIRVQNYHFNPATGNYLEASAAQGDDGVVNAGNPTIADVIRARADGQNK